MRPEYHLITPTHANEFLWFIVILHFRCIRVVIGLGKCDCIIVRVCLMLLVYSLCIG